MTRVYPECDGADVRRWSMPVAERSWRNDFYARAALFDGDVIRKLDT